MSDRRSFRNVLISRLGVTLAAALAVVGVVLWLLAVLWTNHQLLVPLVAEAGHVAEIISDGGSIATEQYDWSEPHHRYATERIDPFFLQVFDSSGLLLRASENVGAFAAPYPTKLLASTRAASSTWFKRPLRFSVGQDRLYALVTPIIGNDGSALGAVQVARFDLGLESAFRDLALGLFVAYLVVLSLLLGLLTVTSRRVLKPLELLTASAASLGYGKIAERVDVPPDADQETTRLAIAINQALHRIAETFDEVQRFTSDAAHELQTPLAVLKGHIEVALRREREPEQYRETLGILKEEADSMAELVRGLLELARLDDTGTGPARSTNVLLQELVEEECALVRPDVEDRGCTLNMTIAQGATVQADPDQLRSAIRNILGNAAKYTDSGTIDVVVSAADGRATVTVADSGRGIRDEDMLRLTERFFRARDVANIPGHGIGLALVASIVQRHDGALSIRKRPSGGTVVELAFPAASIESISDDRPGATAKSFS